MPALTVKQFRGFYFNFSVFFFFCFFTLFAFIELHSTFIFVIILSYIVRVISKGNHIFYRYWKEFSFLFLNCEIKMINYKLIARCVCVCFYCSRQIQICRINNFIYEKKPLPGVLLQFGCIYHRFLLQTFFLFKFSKPVVNSYRIKYGCTRRSCCYSINHPID